MKDNSAETRVIDPRSEPAISRSRRRLVKSAAVAAPVILTLPSGAAAATASAFQCIARDHEKALNNPPAELVESPDGWVREQTTCTTDQDGKLTVEPSPDGSQDEFQCFKLIKFDLDGNVVTSGGGPVTPSCYASFG
ncbi:MAG TPA: hypothetical protein ENI90_00930 [Methylothermaceae bacterium]|nr:hypothetical protein [Methylothermaceae bacterium]